MNSFLRSLSIQHFRGACRPVTLSFSPNKRIALISGNNGTGKSTICDALEVVGCANIGSIEDKKFGSSGVNKKSFLPSLDKTALDVRISVETVAGTWVATLGKREISVTPAPDALDIRVLRRSNILRMVEAKGVDRYDVMRAFLDLSRIEAVEKSLREAAKNLAKRANQSAELLTVSSSQIDQLWKDNGTPGDSASEWAAKLEEPTDSPILDVRAAYEKARTVLSGISTLSEELSQKEIAYANADSNASEAQEQYDAILAK